MSALALGELWFLVNTQMGGSDQRSNVRATHGRKLNPFRWKQKKKILKLFFLIIAPVLCNMT